MKNILSKLLIFALILSLCAFVVSCKEDKASTSVAPYTYEYNLKTDAKTSKQYYSIKGFSISSEVSKYVDKGDFKKVAEIFNTEVKDENGKVIYAKPQVDYTESSVRKLTVPSVAYQNGEALKDSEGNEIPVTCIESQAFLSQNLFNEVVVNDNITVIESGAFSGCSALEKITLPFVGKKINAKNSEKHFGYIFGGDELAGTTSTTAKYNNGDSENSATFFLPTKLTSVVITGGNKFDTVGKDHYYLVKKDHHGEEIDDEVKDTEYYANEELPDGDADKLKGFIYNIKDDSLAIPSYAFYGCDKLESVEIKGEYTKILPFTFYGCSSIKEYAFGDDITEIGESAFESCVGLISVDFNNVTTVGKNAFKGCTNLGFTTNNFANTLTVKAGMEIGESAFEGCTNVKTIEFEANVTIGTRAFKGLTNLRVVTFANGCQIGELAFNGCTKIEELDLTSSGIYVKTGAFLGCTALKSLDYSGEIFEDANATFDDIDKFDK